MPGYILKPFEDHNLRPWYLSDNSIQITSEIINIATCYQQICWARFMMVAHHFTLLGTLVMVGRPQTSPNPFRRWQQNAEISLY